MHPIYTFAYCDLNEAAQRKYHISRRRFNSIDDASEAARKWMAVCFENDYTVMVWLMRNPPSIK